ncbi:MAG: ABC transporter permease [Clostridia bacterium]|nr:ABC transporter permease [Clostridia bacterium]
MTESASNKVDVRCAEEKEESFLGIIVEIFREHKNNLVPILEMAKTDFIKTYRGAALGWSWGLIKPGVRLFIYWFAVVLGLKAGRAHGDIPYFAFLFSGMVPWFYMQDMLNQGTGIFRKYSHLITKMRFPVSTIPTFFSISHLLTHLFLLIICIVVITAQGFALDLYTLQLIPTIILMFIFFDAWALFGSTLGALSRDFMHLVSSFTMAFFWLSGIFFDIDGLSNKILREVLSWNPISFIVSSYRKALIYKEWIWDDMTSVYKFLIMMGIMIIAALWLYRKTRKDIADVI